jgi:small neutral amino acid transporter SnatA (MarC family)
MATVLLLASRQPDRMLHWIGALTLAMALSGIVLLTADRIRRWLGSSMVSAIEKLMGPRADRDCRGNGPGGPQALFL